MSHIMKDDNLCIHVSVCVENRIEIVSYIVYFHENKDGAIFKPKKSVALHTG